MYFAVGYKHFAEGESFSSLALSYDEVGEVYFPWVDEPSGRPLLGYGEGDDSLTIKQVLKEELCRLRQGGKRLDLLLNANCYGAYAMSAELESRVVSILEELSSWDCFPQVVTTASPFVAAMVKRHFPDIETRASVNMRLTTVQAMEYLFPWFDSFYIGRDVQRNLETLRRFSDSARGEGRKLGLLANSGCLRNCPWQTYHDNLIAHSAQAVTIPAARDFNPHLCWTLYNDKKNFPELLRATWIRPEDLHIYEPYVDFVKLATRQHGRPRLVVDAYCSRSFRGNLPDLLEPGFSPAFAQHGAFLDNSAFPAGWAEKVSRCSRECERCGWCDEVFRAVCTRSGLRRSVWEL